MHRCLKTSELPDLAQEPKEHTAPWVSIARGQGGPRGTFMAAVLHPWGWYWWGATKGSQGHLGHKPVEHVWMAVLQGSDERFSLHWLQWELSHLPHTQTPSWWISKCRLLSLKWNSTVLILQAILACMNENHLSKDRHYDCFSFEINLLFLLNKLSHFCMYT